ncbi:hypothetical protein [Haloplanus natans]|uniref:hypothetical protein n=1 Tax=Haloplanus natans TaxID=376171 RepID=UPI000677CB6F|nr:hypothetical protein [Haloplanus natans]
MASETDDTGTVEFEDPGVEDVAYDEYDDLPSTDIETELHVHFGMAGSFPLRLVDMFFADDGLHIVEYSYITPMFGLGFKKHRREAGAMQDVYEVHGIDEVLLQADTVHWLNYRGIDRVLLHRGGFVGRPKLTVYPADGSRSHAIRLHEEDDPDALAESLREVAEGRPFDVVVENGSGFDPLENVQRFFS